MSGRNRIIVVTQFSMTRVSENGTITSLAISGVQHDRRKWARQYYVVRAVRGAIREARKVVGLKQQQILFTFNIET